MEAVGDKDKREIKMRERQRSAVDIGRWRRWRRRGGGGGGWPVAHTQKESHPAVAAGRQGWESR